MKPINTSQITDIIGRVETDNVTFLAAAIAYYAFVSLIPALVLALVVASIVGGDALARDVVMASQRYLTPSAQEALSATIESAPQRSEATIISILLITWSALRVFRGFGIAFSRIYRTTTTPSFQQRAIDAIVVVVAIGFGIGSMVMIGTVLSITSSSVVMDILGLGFLLVSLFVVFLPLYYVFPDREVTLRSVLPGTMFAAVSWVVLQALFQLYTTIATQFALYGLIGGVLLIVTWFYIAAIAILCGATINAVLDDQQPST